MLTPNERQDLRVAIADYRAALADGDNDAIADTAEVLDAVIGAMDLERHEPHLCDALVSTIEDEQDFDDAIATLDRAVAEHLTEG